MRMGYFCRLQINLLPTIIGLISYESMLQVQKKFLYDSRDYMMQLYFILHMLTAATHRMFFVPSVTLSRTKHQMENVNHNLFVASAQLLPALPRTLNEPNFFHFLFLPWVVLQTSYDRSCNEQLHRSLRQCTHC